MFVFPASLPQLSKGLAATLAMVGLAAGPAAGATCSARSGPLMVPLVELYTSEGCSSCPPADRWLSAAFAKGNAARAGVPLAFHVDYWDRLGWKDRFATASNTERQYDGMRANRARFVYTPQVLVQGRDFPDWHDGRAAGALAALAAKPARADITLEAEPQGGSIAVRATARITSPADRKGSVLYVALATDGLVSEVRAGENVGVRLVHDHVVRALRAGPMPDANGDVAWSFALPMPSEAGSASTIVAFVQKVGAGDVLQALALPLAAPCR